MNKTDPSLLCERSVRLAPSPSAESCPVKADGLTEIPIKQGQMNDRMFIQSLLSRWTRSERKEPLIERESQMSHWTNEPNEPLNEQAEWAIEWMGEPNEPLNEWAFERANEPNEPSNKRVSQMSHWTNKWAKWAFQRVKD